MVRYAKVIAGVVDTISYAQDPDNIEDGYILVPDDVFAGFIDEENGVFSAPVTPIVDFDAEDLSALNNVLSLDGSVVRALAEIMFTEINNLRSNAGLNTYTKAQFVNALKNKMRT